MLRFPGSPFGKVLQFEEYPKSPMGSGSRAKEQYGALDDWFAIVSTGSYPNPLTTTDDERALFSVSGGLIGRLI